MKMTAFSDTAPCNLVEIDRRLKGACYLNHQGDHRLLNRRFTSTRLHGAISQKTVILNSSNCTQKIKLYSSICLPIDLSYYITEGHSFVVMHVHNNA
jgi:hypothetical protein